MRILKSITVGLMLMWTLQMTAQSDLLFNNHQINTIARNPAAIENNGFINAYLGAHQQWIGFEDAPNMQWGHVSTFFDKQNMGVSLNVSNQSAGVALTQHIKLGYAYHVLFKGGHQLSLGIGAGVYFRRIDYSMLTFEEDEPELPVSDRLYVRPDFDFGFEYRYQQFTAGAAVNHMTVFNSRSTLVKIPIQAQYYLRYDWNAAPDLIITPGLGYFNSGTISTVSLSADLDYRQLFSVGVNYRTTQSIIIRAGVALNEVFEVRYAYDMGTGKFATYHTGIHEFVIVARLRKRNAALSSPRFIDN